MHYKTLQINGLITAEEDHNRKFLAEFQEKYENDLKVYNQVFGVNYILRNDTAADGDISYNNNTFLRHSDESTGNYFYDEQQYPNSIFGTSYEGQHDIYLFENWFWEREFREELIEWLNDGEPKLYRSMPEGNIAVMVTDVSLTPNNQIGRRTYNFSATLYEIGDGYDVNNLESLGIMNIPRVKREYVTTAGSGSAIEDETASLWEKNSELSIGQLYKPHIYTYGLIRGSDLSGRSSYPWNELTLTERLQQIYSSAYDYIDKETLIHSMLLQDVKIQFTSKPHWYKYQNGSWVFTTKIENTNRDALFLGYKLLVYPLTLTSSASLPSSINLKGDVIGQIKFYNNDYTAIILVYLSGKTYTGEVSYLINKKGVSLLDKVSACNIEFNEDTDEWELKTLTYKNGENDISIFAESNDDDQKYETTNFTLYTYENATKIYQSPIEVLVNEKGYYQIPSNTYIYDLQLCQDWDIEEDNEPISAIIDYILFYQKTITAGHIPDKISTATTILGQLGGMFPTNTQVGEKIYERYNYYEYGKRKDAPGVDFFSGNYSLHQYLDTWQGISLDVTPYTVCNIIFAGDQLSRQDYVIGRSGNLTILENMPTKNITFIGKRMFEVDYSLQPYFDEWEFAWHPDLYDTISSDTNRTVTTNWLQWLDGNLSDTGIAVNLYMDNYLINTDSGSNVVAGVDQEFFIEWVKLNARAVTDITEPQYNIVYAIEYRNQIQYYIYYIDDKWYPITFDASNSHVILAHVPVYGYISYKGNLIREEFN